MKATSVIQIVVLVIIFLVIVFIILHFLFPKTTEIVIKSASNLRIAALKLISRSLGGAVG